MPPLGARFPSHRVVAVFRTPWQRRKVALVPGSCMRGVWLGKALWGARLGKSSDIAVCHLQSAGSAITLESF